MILREAAKKVPPPSGRATKKRPCSSPKIFLKITSIYYGCNNRQGRKKKKNKKGNKKNGNKKNKKNNNGIVNIKL